MGTDHWSPTTKDYITLQVYTEEGTGAGKELESKGEPVWTHGY